MAPVSTSRVHSALHCILSRDGISGVLLILSGAVALYLNRGLSYGTPTAMGPGFFPRLLAIALILSGLWIFMRGLVSGGGDVTWGDIASAPWRGLLVVSASILVFALVLDTAGLVVSGALLLFGAGFAAPRVRWMESVLFAVIMSLAVAAIFVWGLKVTIPLWPSL